MAKSALLLMNLGSPDSPDKKALKKYLTQFLMDERVIDVPAWWRSILVKGIIVPFRAAKSAKAYQSIWTKEGSPLVTITRELTQAVASQHTIPVDWCMRYGNPSPTQVIGKLLKNNPELEEIILLPLYPHYAWSSYETAVEFVKDSVNLNKFPVRLKVIPPFYKHPLYIRALADSIRPFIARPFDLLVFSYHGIPERHVTGRHGLGVHDVNDPNHCCYDPSAQATCYRHQVITTTKLVAAELGLPSSKYTLSFQSRLGRDPWLKPYTAQRLTEWPAEGQQNILMACPAFVSDCLETLEEMGKEGEHIFTSAGGESFTLIPCLNLHASWLKCIQQLVREQQQPTPAIPAAETVGVHY